MAVTLSCILLTNEVIDEETSQEFVKQEVWQMSEFVKAGYAYGEMRKTGMECNRSRRLSIKM